MQYSEQAPASMAIVPLSEAKNDSFLSSSGDENSESALNSHPSLPKETVHLAGSVPLTPLWEHVVRSKNLPESVDLDGFFKVIHQRVRNPEWVVRQHALRVLKDVIPLLGGSDSLDERMQTVLADVVANLGHLGPAVRKAAVDCLKTYLMHSTRTDRILRDLVEKGIKNAAEYKVQPNMVLGIILALPFLLRNNNKVSQDTMQYAIHCLLDKLVQVTHQDTVMRALLRIRESIGKPLFDGHLEMYWQPSIKRDFDALCDVYNLSSFTVEPGEESKGPEDEEYKPPPDAGPHLGDLKTNFFYVKDESNTQARPMYPNEKPGNDRVILETEIKLDSGPAITMKIHEEGATSSDNPPDGEKGSFDSEEEISNSKTFRVIKDDDNQDFYYDEIFLDHIRRTPRRVRFGGEVVKMRTPDSDSNQPSDVDGETTPRINRTRGGGKSLIPVSVQRAKKASLMDYDTQSAPNSPSRNSNLKPKNKKLSNSSPNLYRHDELFGSKVNTKNMSRIPLKFEGSTNKVSPSREAKGPRAQGGNKENSQDRSSRKPSTPKQGKEQINVAETNAKSPERQGVSKGSPERRLEDSSLKPPSKSSIPRDRSVSPGRIVYERKDQFSPIPVHNEIEMIHNLTRSPERSPAKNVSFAQSESKNSPNSVMVTPEKKLSQSERAIIDTSEVTKPKNIRHSADSVSSKVSSHKSMRNVPASATEKKGSSSDYSKEHGILKESNAQKQHQSFHVYQGNGNSNLEDSMDDYPVIPTKNGGNCLTCSSSGSDSATTDTNIEKIESLGIIDKKIVKDLQAKEDVWKRHYALQELHQEIRSNPAIVESLEPCAPQFFQLLFSLMDQQSSLLQPLAEQTLTWFLNKCSDKLLSNDRVQNVLLHGLSRMGSPAGVRMAMVLAQRIPPGRIVDKLASEQILGAKSAKVREGSLQILMAVCRLYPSTEVDVPGTVARLVPALVGDKKSRVRRGALEALAALAQLGSPGLVLDVAAGAANNREDGDQLMGVVRSRLSRRQLPAVDLRNGTVRYSTPCPLEEDWVSRGSTTPPESSVDSATLPANHKHLSSKVRRSSLVNTPATLVPGPRRSSATYLPNYWKEQSYKNRILTMTSHPGVVVKEPELKPWEANAKLSATGRSINPNLQNSNQHQQTQVWAIDSKTFGVIDNERNSNYGLRPVYTMSPQIKPEKNNKRDATTNYEYIHMDPEPPPEDKRLSSSKFARSGRRSVRGRSFSPPKNYSAQNGYRIGEKHYESEDEVNRQRIGSYNGALNVEQHRQYDGGGSLSRMSSSRHTLDSSRQRNMRKSFSSEQLPSSGVRDTPSYLPDRRMPNLQTQSLSSGSSIGSGVSLREGNESNWYRHGRMKQLGSAIPIPIGVPINNNAKLRLRTSSSSGESRRIGPVTTLASVNVHPENIYNERNHLKGMKPPSSHHKNKLIATNYEEYGVDETDRAITRQPFSSGSDSSGYFTPPAEPHLHTEEVTTTTYDEEEALSIPPQDIRVNPCAIQPMNQTSVSEEIEDEIRTPTPKQMPSAASMAAPLKSFVRMETEEDEDEANKVPERVQNSRNSNNINIVDNDNYLTIDEVSNATSDDEANSNHTITYDTPVMPNIDRRQSLSEEMINIENRRNFDDQRALSKSYADIKTVENNNEIHRKSVNSAPLTFQDVDTSKGLLEVSPIKLAKTPLPGAVVNEDDDDEEDIQENRNYQILEEKHQNYRIKAIEYNDDRRAFHEYKENVYSTSPKKPHSEIPRLMHSNSLSRSKKVTKKVVGQNMESHPPQRQPREHITDVLLKLSSPEWEKIVQGLEGVGRLFKHFNEMTDTHIHQLSTSVGRHIKNLRSQVSRAACLAAVEAFKNPRRALEAEIEELAVPLLQRTADTNRFLRADANAALDEMISCSQFPPPKLVYILTLKGGAHQNAVVRCAAARLLCALCQKLGPGRVFQLPKDTRDRILLFGANMLTEGSLETRKHAKIMLGFLSQHSHFQKAMDDAVPSTTMRHISKTLESLK